MSSGFDSSSRSDVATVLINHINVVNSKIDVIHALFKENGKLSNFFKTKLGQNLINTVQQANSARQNKSKLPKVSQDVQREVGNLMQHFRATFVSMDYLISWAKNVKALLNDITDNSTDLDIRWNYQVSIQVCQLFVTFCKLTLYFHLKPHIQTTVQMVPLFSDLANLKLSTKYDELHKFVVSSTKNPFSFTQAQLKTMNDQLSILCAQISPFIIQIFGQWPVINWAQFSIFNDSQDPQESTLPPNISLVLQHIPLLRDTILFFSLTYPDYPEKYPQYATLMNSVLTESSTIFITPLVPFPIKTLLKIFMKTSKNQSFDELTEANEYERVLKDEVSHSQRRIHVFYMLRDINDVSSFDPSYIPKLIDNIAALASIGAYEVTLALSSNIVDVTVSTLVDDLVDLGLLFQEHKDLIRRFFLFNLTTIDATYLHNLVSNIKQLTDDWQVRMTHYIEEIVKALMMIDIEDFDRGSRFDLTPLLQTINRLFYLFNQISSRHQAAFLHPIFEHMSTILRHAQIAQDPILYFQSFCPIHQLWSQCNTIQAYIDKLPGGIHNNSAFISLFSFFNLDKIEFSLNPSMVKLAANTLTGIREFIIKNIETIIQQFFKPNSEFIQIFMHTNPDVLFNPVPYQFNQAEFDYKKVQNQTQYRAASFQIREFVRKIPMEINLCGNPVSFLSTISDTITIQLAQLMFGDQLPNTNWLHNAFSGAPEFFWPLFLQMSASFPHKFLTCKEFHSKYSHQETYLEQIALIRQSAPPKSASVAQTYQLISKLEEKVAWFLKEGYKRTIFNAYGDRFHVIAQKDLPQDFATIISYRGMKQIITELGPQGGFCLNKIIVNEIADAMVKIFKIHDACLTQISDWYVQFRQKKIDWMTQASLLPQLKTASQEMIRLGAALQLRGYLRRAIFEVISQCEPGLVEIINAALIKDNGEHLSEKQDFLHEMVSGMPSFHFIKLAIDKNNLIKTTNCQQFYFFIALFLLNPDWKDIKFIPENEGFTHNLHLFPTALDAFLSTNGCFVSANDGKKVEEGLSVFFDTLSQVIIFNTQDLDDSNLLGPSLTIFADLFPKYISKLQYGTVSKAFPLNVVLDAYTRYSQLLQLDVQTKKKRKGKGKGKKNKKK